jgi:hypothetical protein
MLQWPPKSRNRTTSPVQTYYNRNLFLTWGRFYYLIETLLKKTEILFDRRGGGGFGVGPIGSGYKQYYF